MTHPPLWHGDDRPDAPPSSGGGGASKPASVHFEVGGAAIVRPGDTLVIGRSGIMTDQEFAELGDVIRPNLPGVKVCVIDDVTSLTVYRPEAAE